MKKCLVADKPIRCYKIVSKVGKTGDGFKSLLRRFKYNLGKTYELECFFPEKNKFCHLDVHEGFHSYAHAKHANEDCYDVGREDVSDPNLFTGEVMLLCEIPVGAKYWIGNDCLGYGKDYAEYCSNALKVVGWKMKYEKNWRKS